MLTTILAAVIIFILSQYFLKFILEPMKELKQAISRVSFSLSYYANIYCNINVASKEDIIRMSREFRELASSLISQVDSIPLFDAFRGLFQMPDKMTIHNSTPDLIGLSNTTSHVPSETIEKRVNNIKELLNVKG